MTQKLTKSLTEADIILSHTVARRIHKLILDEYPDTNAMVIAGGIYILQMELKNRFGIEVTTAETVTRPTLVPSPSN